MGGSNRETEITQSIIKFRKLLLFLVWFTSFLSLFVLLVVQVIFPQPSGHFLAFHSNLVIVLILVCVIVVSFAHFRMLPKARRIKDPFLRFNVHLKALMIVVNILGLSGLFMGLTTLLLERVALDWLEIGVFFIFSFTYGTYLLIIEILPVFRDYQI
ncbi:MAG: hypothetical protein ACFFFG_00175 [Candidatus Thorarchaeota archaeon]